MDRRRHIHRFVVAAVVVALATGVATPAVGKPVPYFARNAAQEAVLSEMALHPAAIRIGDVTYIGYQGPGFDPYVAARESATGTWYGPTRVGTNPLRLDAHGAPSLFADAAGRVHAFFGSHGGSILHSRQTAAGPSASWTAGPSPATGTYPQSVPLTDGRMLLFYRTAEMHWSFRSTADGAATFGPENRVLAADDDAYWYADFRGSADGTVHAVFTWLDRDLMRAGRLFVRRNVYYARRLADGTWRGLDGSVLSLPLSLADANAHCRLVDSGSGFVNEISVKPDASGTPCIVYLIGAGSGPGAFTWRFIRLGAAGRTASAICTTDHYFDAATLDPRPDGTLEAFVVTGDSDARGSRDWDYRGRGGRIERWVSTDGGVGWSLAGRVSPVEPGIIYSDPVLVTGGDASARLVFTDWTDDESDFFHRMFLWGDGGLVLHDTPLAVARIAGRNRSSTAVEVSKRAFPEGARFVVIATERDFPDALCGAPLAAAVNGPVLLTPATYLPDAVAAEIRRLGAKNVIVLGGAAAVSETVVSQLRTRAGVTSVERLAGSNRYQTALLISRRMRDTTRTITTAVIVSGRTWPDAVAAAPLASANDWPIVLVDGGWLPPDSKRILTEYGVSRTIIVGQSGVVGAGIERQVPNPSRVGGSDRFATAALLAEYSLGQGLLPGRAIVATGLNFPDALAAGPLGGRARAPVLLVRPSELPAPVAAYIERNASSLVDLWVIGEPDVISESVTAGLAEAGDAY